MPLMVFRKDDAPTGTGREHCYPGLRKHVNVEAALFQYELPGSGSSVF